MDAKWLRLNNERAALYGERLEVMDYSPEIGAWLKVICFPTFDEQFSLAPGGTYYFDLSGDEYSQAR